MLVSREFQLIYKYFRHALDDSPEVRCGIGDDAAIISVPSGMELALSMDTLVDGIHFPSATTPQDIGYKSLAVNLSDMAAMGAEPRWISLSLTMPAADEAWLQRFMEGFTELAGHYSLSLIGGDLTHGPLSITVQIFGLVPPGQAIYRHGARAGDRIYVSGTLGDAGMALDLLQSGRAVNDETMQAVMLKLNRPVPRVELGIALRGIASSAIDISDGLLSDLEHVVTASRVGARVNVGKIPVSDTLKSYRDILDFAISAGDDYELCFTVEPGKSNELAVLEKQYPITCIGEITDGDGIHWLRADGSDFNPARQEGYSHF